MFSSSPLRFGQVFRFEASLRRTSNLPRRAKQLGLPSPPDVLGESVAGSEWFGTCASPGALPDHPAGPEAGTELPTDER